MKFDPESDSIGRGRARTESPLAWLRRRKDKSGAPLVRDEQFRAGERLAADFRRAEMMGRITMAWDGLPTGGRGRASGSTIGVDMRDGAVAARESVGRALKAVGPDFAGVLVDICCYETGLEQLERRSGWPERSGKVVVQYALNALARHYGLLPLTGDAWSARSGLRHWGADGYRPSVDPE